jgi:cysteine-rich repeat protein
VVDGLGGAAAVVVSPDNIWIYAASTGQNEMAVFEALCGNGQFDPGEECDDGNTVNGDCCSATCTNEPAGTVCDESDDLCIVYKCNGAGICVEANNPVPCDDGNFCSVNDVCSNKTCVGTPRDCSGIGFECHPGICDEEDDECIALPAANGTSCDDGDACTRTDECTAGACVGQNPVICTPLDQCHDAGTCDPATGVCDDPLKNDGSGCDDGDGCTQIDICIAGACIGQEPVVCPQPDQCHLMGTCDPATGACSAPEKPTGTACDDGDACTQVDICQAGACVGANPVTCTVQDQCHVLGACDPTTGVCSNPEAADGTACDDGNLCTQTDTCQAGVCVGANPIVCTALDQCHDAGVCDPASGVCSDPEKSDGAACDDGDACTQEDACLTGLCLGANPVVCTAQDQCHDAGTCDPATGVCSDPAKADGTLCDDGSLCTETDTCTAGVCQGTNVVTCVAQDQCHGVGTCDPATGVCSDPAKPDGAACDDSDLCTPNPTCA